MKSGTKLLAVWVLKLLRNQGLSDDAQVAALADFGIYREQLLGPDAWIDESVACAIWSRHAGDHASKAYGVEFARSVDPRELGLVGYIAGASPTVGEALERVTRFHRLNKSHGGAEIRVDNKAFTVIERPARGVVWPRHFAEAVIGTYLSVMRRLTPEPIQPISVQFRHRAGAQHPFWGCPVRFGARDHALSLPMAVMNLPIITRDETLLHYLEDLARLKPAHEPVWLQDLREMIGKDLGSAEPRQLSHFASQLFQSVRTLQRKLRVEGYTYVTLRDDVRRRRAMQLASDPQLNATERAFALGFTDGSALRKAEKRWKSQ